MAALSLEFDYKEQSPCQGSGWLAHASLRAEDAESSEQVVDYLESASSPHRPYRCTIRPEEWRNCRLTALENFVNDPAGLVDDRLDAVEDARDELF